MDQSQAAHLGLSCLLYKMTSLFSSPAEDIICSDPQFSRKDNYFMNRSELYEAATRKRCHLQKTAERLGWLQEGLELYYAQRCSLLGQPSARDHRESPTPSPVSH